MTTTTPGELLALENRKDAQAFCAAAFGPFVLDVAQYVEIVAELMQHATDRALAAKPADEARWQSLQSNIQSKIDQLKHYRDNDCQLSHARVIAEGRILQANQDLIFIAQALSTTGEPKPIVAMLQSDQVVVPREPTQAMLRAATGESPKAIWQAMLNEALK